MATDEGDTTPSPLDGAVEEGADPTDGTGSGPGAVVGSYTWDDFLREHGEETAAGKLYQRFDETPGSERWGEEERSLTPEDWERTDVDPEAYLGFPPWEIESRIAAAHRVAEDITDYSELIGYAETPAIKDIYGWEDYKREYFYDENGDPPQGRFDDEPEEFDAEEALGLPPETIDATMADCNRAAEELDDLIDERTVDVDAAVDEDAFFSDPQGRVTVANRYDLEKTVPMAKKQHFREEDRYWVNKPYSYVVIFHSTKENEIKYYVVQPHLTEIEEELSTYLTDKLRASIKYEDEGGTAGDEAHRRSVIESKTRELLNRYDLYDEPNESGDRNGFGNRVSEAIGLDPSGGISGRVVDLLGYKEPVGDAQQLDGIEARPEPVLLAEDSEILNEYQVEKLLYYLERDFIGYELIDGIKHDINVEDISCDGYNSPVFVYHSDYEQIITNIYHGEEELDDFVVKLAQRSGKGISKRRPQVDATLPDGSRAQLTLGREVSDHGTNYTIRQFKDVPFTPVDLINWQTFSLDQMAFLWLCIENHKSLIFAGGTASGKTTSLNAVSLFIPSNTKIVSIEDTREVELPQRNWIASVTRPSFSDDDKGDVDEFDLLEAALRQRPDYIVMGEIRGEEGRTLFQVMSTGHTTYTTFHADNVGEVLKRFTTEPINVSKTMFSALDLVSIQTSTRVQGQKVRRNKSLTEINHYDAENDEINVQDVYQWQAETDEFLKMGDSNTLDEIMFDRGWDRDKLDNEIFKRQTVLAYLIHEGLNTYTQVAATFQAFINDPETILSLMANDQLEASLEDLREMESVLIDIDPEKEEMVPRPDPNDDIFAETEEILDRAQEELFEQYRGETPEAVADALVDTQPQGNVEATPDTAGELPAAADENVEFDEGEQDRAMLDDDEESAESTPELEAGDAADAPAESDDSDQASTAPNESVEGPSESAEAPVDSDESVESSSEPDESADAPAEFDEEDTPPEPDEEDTPSEPDEEDTPSEPDESADTPSESEESQETGPEFDAPTESPTESDDSGEPADGPDEAVFAPEEPTDRDSEPGDVPTELSEGDESAEPVSGADEAEDPILGGDDSVDPEFEGEEPEEPTFGVDDSEEPAFEADEPEDPAIDPTFEEAAESGDETGNGDGFDVDSWGFEEDDEADLFGDREQGTEEEWDDGGVDSWDLGDEEITIGKPPEDEAPTDDDTESENLDESSPFEEDVESEETDTGVDSERFGDDGADFNADADGLDAESGGFDDADDDTESMNFDEDEVHPFAEDTEDEAHDAGAESRILDDEEPRPVEGDAEEDVGPNRPQERTEEDVGPNRPQERTEEDVDPSRSEERTNDDKDPHSFEETTEDDEADDDSSDVDVWGFANDPFEEGEE